LSSRRDRGALAIVLHTHMPYVEGFGTWPFGEEWLWEAIAGSYLPLLDLLDSGAPLTLSLTPVLCDQLEADGWQDRFAGFIDDVRRPTHAEDAQGMRRAGHVELARELDRAWSDYERALEILERRRGDLLGALAPPAHWTSSATHAVLPLLATDAGVRVQVQSGIDSHRARFGEHWRGGFWLPECAHARRLEALLVEAGAHATCVELTNRFGLGASEHLHPLIGDAGVVLMPVDRATMDLVWSDRGYPADAAYRDYHHHTVHHHTPWSNDGCPYDRARAIARAREHAADFVARTSVRLADAGAGLPGGGLAVCALDTELLGHWWYEGVEWLAAVVHECTRQGLELVTLDDALARCEPVAASWRETHAPASASSCELDETTSWGAHGDLSTWSGPRVAELAFAQRRGELAVIAAGALGDRVAVRELLALQSSDWAFMLARGISAPYARERAAGHSEALQRALAAPGEGDERALRNLARHVTT
jgi:1,4-alpha-glucan branching enzyme